MLSVLSASHTCDSLRPLEQRFKGAGEQAASSKLLKGGGKVLARSLGALIPGTRKKTSTPHGAFAQEARLARSATLLFV